MINLRFIRLWFLPLFLLLVSCSLGAGRRNVSFFKDTKAYELAKAVQKADLKQIETLVKEDSTLLTVTNPVSENNVLALCLHVGQFESLKKLLKMGADPNFINSKTKSSVLMESCSYFGNFFNLKEDNRYAELLLQYGADPTYALENDFTNEKGYSFIATSPLMQASGLNLQLVKTLIQYGADPYRKLGKERNTPFAHAVATRSFDIIQYYIDSFNVDIHQPMSVVLRKPDNVEVTYYIQDYIMEFMAYKDGTEGFEKKQKLIKYLEAKGVDFENYEYQFR